MSFFSLESAECPWEGEHHVELTYDPIHFHALACSCDHIFVVDSAPGGGVQVHTWSGQHIQNLSCQQLGLKEEDWIFAVHCDDRKVVTLELAVGDYGSQTVHSLRRYTVSNIKKM